MTILLYIVSLYLGFGLFFALWFAVSGVDRMDGAARGSGFLFRLLITPGVVALWPLMLSRCCARRSE